MIQWLKAAGVRAVKTACQTAVAMLPVGMTLADVTWEVVASTAALAAVISLLNSVAGIPEAWDGAPLPAIAKGAVGDDGE